MKNKLEKIGQNSFMDNFVKTDDILNDMCGIIESSQKAAYQAVNIALVQRNWLLGYRIAILHLQFGILKANFFEHCTCSKKLAFRIPNCK